MQYFRNTSIATAVIVTWKKKKLFSKYYWVFSLQDFEGTKRLSAQYCTLHMHFLEKYENSQWRFKTINYTPIIGGAHVKGGGH